MLEGCWGLWPSSPTWLLIQSSTAAPQHTWHPLTMQIVRNISDYFLGITPVILVVILACVIQAIHSHVKPHLSDINWCFQFWFQTSNASSNIWKVGFKCHCKKNAAFWLIVDHCPFKPRRTDGELQRLCHSESAVLQGPEVQDHPTEGRPSPHSHSHSKDPTLGSGEKH